MLTGWVKAGETDVLQADITSVVTSVLKAGVTTIVTAREQLV